MKTRFGVFAAAAGLLLGSVPGFAHHSFAAEFDVKQPLRLKGAVTKVEWTNPHVWIYMDVANESGIVEHWQCEPGAPIELLAEAAGDRIALEVKDRGPGFPPGDEHRVFEKFWRGAGGSSGIGLGLTIANLVDLVAAGGAETLRSRIQLMDLARSVCRAILVDAEKESFERVATSFAGLPEVMDKLMMRMSAAAEQPVTLLYGRSPAGMNATGESDIRGWYDNVAEGQTDELKPRLERLLTLMFLAKDSPTRGVVPSQWCIEFNPLWLPTDKEEADTKKVIADTYVALVGGNIMTDAEAGIGLASDFPTIDVEARTELAEADKEEGVRPREVNTPPVPEPGDEGGGPPEGGGDSKAPKADRADSSQPRVPAGSPRGGQWTSSGGGGGGVAPAAGPAGSGSLTNEQRAGIRASLASGKNAAVTALQQKLVARYGVPLAQASLMYERDIKQQLKAAKERRAGERAEKLEAKRKVTEALAKSKAALDKAIADKKLADDAKKKAADDQGKAKADKAREKRRLARERKTKKRLEAEAEKKRIADEEAKKQAKAKKEQDEANRGAHPDVDAHEKALKDQYGDAARTVAWGRAMHDRGRALDLDDYSSTMKAMVDRGMHGFNYHDRIWVRDVIRKHKPKTVGELADHLKAAQGLNQTELRKLGERIEAGGAVAAHRKALEKAGATHADDKTLPDGTVVKSINLKPMTVKQGSVITDAQVKPVIDKRTGRTLQTGYVPSSYDIVDGQDRNLANARTGIDNARKRLTALAHKDIKQPEEHQFLADDEHRAYHMSKQSGHYEDRINVGAQKTGQGPDAYEKVMIH